MTSAAFRTSPRIPRYLRAEQEKIESIAAGYGLDFFPVQFEMVTYDQMNEIAAYGGFPNRYPHWRFGMEYERLAKSTEYGLSKIYELVINNNPAVAYLLEGNSLTDQKLVMCHVLGHVDFFKNNFMFRATDLDATGRVVDPTKRFGPGYEPDRKWIDRMANHGGIVRRLVDRHGIDKVEAFVDHCLSLENLIDPWAQFVIRSRPEVEDLEEGQGQVEVPRLRAKEYMENFINPEDYIAEQKKKIEADREKAKGKFPKESLQDVLSFLIEHAPLERWERSILEVVRQEAYYFLPQIQTKIMNEGWASYWHSRLMTEKVCDASEILDYADNNAAVMATSPGQLNPYKLGVELFRDIEERWDKGQFGREWEDCDDLEVKKNWDLRLGLGRKKVFEVRSLYNDVTFIDEFLTPEFAIRQKLFTFEWSNRSDRFEIESREFRKIKDKMLFQLTNRGNPYVYVEDANYQNRGELLLRHQHEGVDLRPDYAKETLAALVRVWKRPVCVQTIIDGKKSFYRFDGTEHSVKQDSVIVDRVRARAAAALLVVSCGGTGQEPEAPEHQPLSPGGVPSAAEQPVLASTGPAPAPAPAPGPAPTSSAAGPAAVPTGLVPGGLARGGDDPTDQELVQGDRAYRAGDWKVARDHYNAAAKLAPRDPAPRVGLIRVRVASGEVPTEHASGSKNPKVRALLKEVDAVLRANPDYGPAYVERGRLLLVQDRSADALAALERGAALSPDDPEAQSSLGIALLATGKPEAALERLARASAADPDDADRLTNLGTALMMRGRVQDAIVAYRRAVELAPNDPVGLSDLATAYLSAGRPEEAKPLIEKALSIAPDRATFLSNLGYTQHQLKDLPAALSTLKRATQKDPKLASAWINLGDVYVDQGQLEEAERAYKKALELDKTDPRAQASWNDFGELKRKLGK